MAISEANISEKLENEFKIEHDVAGGGGSPGILADKIK